MAGQSLWLQLLLNPALSNRRRIALLQRFGSLDAALAASHAELAAELGEAKARAVREGWLAAREDKRFALHEAWLAEPGNSLLTLDEADYPRCLLDLPDPPVALFAKGQRDCLLHRSLALVGSRNPTAQGAENAAAFARAFADNGIVVVSGLASGIDAAAHEGALAGGGMTIAVVGTGLDRVYPAANRDLAHRIAQRGLILSEYLLGTPALAVNFPQRNRIIAALGSGCLVAEAALGSGSLITARQALDLGREVFAIPGSIHSPLSKGCHWLIKQGAALVESAQDISCELPGWPDPAAAVQSGSTQSAGGDVLQVMGLEPVDLDTLSARTGLTAAALCEILLAFELDGRVFVLPGGRYQRLVSS